MIKEVWNYLKGYVIIEISGFAVERFLNLCVNKNIVLLDIEESTHGVICKVNINDFKKLKEFSKKTGCKYKIKSKYGIRFYIFENRKRTALVISIFMFIALLQFFSSFVWAINVTGTSFVDNNEILKFCEDNNFYLGSPKKNLDPKQLQTDIKNNFDSISWISVQIKGTTVDIKISENIDNVNNTIDLNNIFLANDIISTEDCIIYSISTQSGTPLIKQNDVVSKGDILVSGELFLKDGEEITGSYTTNSEALIRGIVDKTFETEVNFEYNTKSFTGKKAVDYKFKIFNKDFSLDTYLDNIDNFFNSFSFFDIFDFRQNKNDFINYDKTTSINQLKLGENYSLPFIIIKDTYLEYEEVKKIYSEEEAKAYANTIINQKIISEIDFSSDIIEKDIIYKTFDNKLIAYTTLKIIQNIGEKIEIAVIEKPIKNNLENNLEENLENNLETTTTLE